MRTLSLALLLVAVLSRPVYVFSDSGSGTSEEPHPIHVASDIQTASAETYIVPLPGCLGSYTAGQGKPFTIDLGVELLQINEVRFICAGTVTAGLGYLMEPIPDFFYGFFDTDPGYMMARGPTVGASTYPLPEYFSDNPQFVPELGATWDFLLDGQANGVVFLEGIVYIPEFPPISFPTGYLEVASIEINAVPLLVGDFDDNWYVDFVDFSILAADWLECIDPCDSNGLAGDMTNDSCVDINDLGYFVECWLDCYVTAASAPTPTNGQGSADPNGILVWSAGNGALEHDVYFGTDANAVGDANYLSDEFMGTVADANFDPGGLDFNSTYYWRIDEVGPRCTTEGGVWSFTTWAEPDINLGLVSWWEFDEGSGTTAYDSAGDNNGILNGDPNWTTGQIEGALSFDSVDDYVDCGNDESLNITDEITISAWINLKTFHTPEHSQIISKGEWNDAYGLMILDTAIVRISLEGVGQVNANTSLSVNTWYHLAGTYDGSTISLYINGALNNSASASGSIASNTNSVWIGREQYSGGRWTPDGTIDDVRIYDRALSAGEIWQLYQDGL